MAKEFRGIEAIRLTRIPDEEDQPTRTVAAGVFSVVIAISAVVLVITGISTAMGGDFVTGTALGYSAAAASFLAVLVGLFAAITHRGRWFGIAGLLVGFFANPFVLTAVLGWAGWAAV
ncbi:MAG: hypothetical protein JWR53_412 [Glaciihabitans sp.]|nr:hypothetical protein [Glaciihabitans sp.]MDQ1555850.1 hypothetical protein [Actinomycetota bacterium]